MVQTIFLACSDLEFNNPVDPEAKSHNDGVSSSEQTPSSSVGADNHQPSSSSVAQTGSSSSTTPASSSSQRSSSSTATTPVDCTNNTGTGTFPDTRDGKTYKYVTICNQVWMAENLNYETEGGYCYAENVYGITADSIAKNCSKYGRLYNWVTAMALPPACNSVSCKDYIQENHRDICPEGWHIPSNAEWNVLIAYIHADNGLAKYTSGRSDYAGKYLKAISGWRNYTIIKNPMTGEEETISGGGTDKYGFAALPGGIGYSKGDFLNAGDLGVWQSSSENDNCIMEYNRESAVRSQYNAKSSFSSVRCLKD